MLKSNFIYMFMSKNYDFRPTYRCMYNICAPIDISNIDFRSKGDIREALLFSWRKSEGNLGIYVIAIKNQNPKIDDTRKLFG